MRRPLQEWIAGIGLLTVVGYLASPAGSPIQLRGDGGIPSANQETSQPALSITFDQDKCRGIPAVLYLTMCKAPGFEELVAPCVIQSSYPAPVDQKDWAARMAPYVPCVIESLGSPDPCIRQFAIRLLTKIEDNRAVEPLIEYLEWSDPRWETSIEARKALARTFRTSDVVPYLIQAIEMGIIREDVESCTRIPSDPRLFPCLFRLYSEAKSVSDKAAIFRIVARHLPNRDSEGLVKSLFLEWKDRSGYDAEVSFLIEKIAGPDTAEDIIDYYFRHCQDWTRCWRVVQAIQGIGEDTYLLFLRRGFESCQERARPGWGKKLFEIMVQFRAPASFERGEDSTEWMARKASDLLPYAGFDSVKDLMERSPEGSPSASPAARAALWEKASTLFPSNLEVQCAIQELLCKLYGPNVTGEMEKSLGALERALDLDAQRTQGKRPPRPDWIRLRNDLQEKLDRRNLQKGLSIAGLTPTLLGNPTGPFQGKLLLPSDSPWDLVSQPPFCYLDYRNSDGSLTTVPGRLVRYKFSPEGANVLLFTIEPELQEAVLPSSVESVRIRLLYLPKTEGFRGTVSSDFIVP